MTKNDFLVTEAKAIKLVTEQHIAKPYDEGYPYFHHLYQVVSILKEMGFDTDQELILAGWLHDAIEDTGVSYKDVLEGFGNGVADLVYAVTDELGKNRKEKKLKTLPKIREAGTRAISLKLADRLANVRWGIANESDQLSMYKKEFDGFEAALLIGREEDTTFREAKMWAALSSLIRNPS